MCIVVVVYPQLTCVLFMLCSLCCCGSEDVELSQDLRLDDYRAPFYVAQSYALFMPCRLLCTCMRSLEKKAPPPLN